MNMTNSERFADSGVNRIIARRSFLRSALAMPVFITALPELLKAADKASIDRRAATATIYSEGLAVNCFNRAEKRCEKLFLRHDAHNFGIEVTKKLNGKIVESKIYNFAPDSSIEIFGVNPAISGFKRYEPGEFVRGNADSNDPEDFRWMVDIEGELHGEKLLPTKTSAKNGVPLTRVFIRNAEFYTKRKSEQEVYLLDKSGRVLKDFGKIGDVMGAKLDADKVIVRATGKTPFELSLRKEKGAAYEIYIRNLRVTDHSSHITSDFAEYYNVLNDRRGRQFDFRMKSHRADSRLTSLSYRRVSFNPNEKEQIFRQALPKSLSNLSMEIICNEVWCSVTRSILDFR
jgi:hypothetical protein